MVTGVGNCRLEADGPGLAHMPIQQPAGTIGSRPPRQYPVVAPTPAVVFQDSSVRGIVATSLRPASQSGQYLSAPCESGRDRTVISLGEGLTGTRPTRENLWPPEAIRRMAGGASRRDATRI